MNRPGVRLAGLAALWIVGGGCMVGCNVPEQSPRTNKASWSWTAIVLDTGRPLAVRIDAARSVDLQSEQAWSALSRVGWSMRESSRLRVAALSAMVAADATRLWEEAASRWPEEPSGEVEQFLLHAVRDGGESGAAAVLMRWASDRDDALAVETLLAWLGDDGPWAWRVAAWRVLTDGQDRASVEVWLGASKRQGTQPTLVTDLHATVGVLGYWPVRSWELYALRRAMTQTTADARTRFEAFAEQAMRLPTAHRQATAMRHVAWMSAVPEVVRPRLIAETPANHGENAMDALAAAWLKACLQDATIAKDLFAQADADHADDRSEHGGMVMFDAQGSAAFQPYAPAQRRHDRAYIAPASLTLALGQAAATYHFHTERHANAQHAGPGTGDRRAVEQSATLMVVLTFLDRDTLPAHLAGPGDQLFDLGVIPRP